MSVNKYDSTSGTLTVLASGQRLWIGTKAAHDAAVQAGTMPNNILIAITDDSTENVQVVDTVEVDNMSAVTSNAVAEELDNYLGNTGAQQLLNGSLSFDNTNTITHNGVIALGNNITSGRNNQLIIGNTENIIDSYKNSSNLLINNSTTNTVPEFYVSSSNPGQVYLSSLSASMAATNTSWNLYGSRAINVSSTLYIRHSGDQVGISCMKMDKVWKIYNLHYDDLGNGQSKWHGCGLMFGKQNSYSNDNEILPLWYDETINEDSYIDSCQLDHTTSDGKVDLGSSTTRWKQIYATNSTISTSDRNKKKEIEYFSRSSTWTDDELVMFINDLKPCTYKLIENQSNRPHHGLIAQDVEETLKALNKDHAGFIKSPIPITIEEEKEYTVKEINLETGLEEEVTKTKKVKRSVIPEYPSYTYSLRYEEFISDLIRYCQLLETRMKKLEIKLGE